MVKKLKDIQYYEGIGRRKEAVARVRLHIVTKEKAAVVDGTKVSAGVIILNGKPIEKTFAAEFQKKQYLHAFELTNTVDRFAVTIKTEGGGKVGQLEAIVHGISRALCLVDNEVNKPPLKKEKMLTRDPRTRERRMVGTGGKSRRAKQSPKR